MKQKILYALIIISVIVMIGDIMLYYEQQTGRIIMIIASIIGISSYLLSDLNEDLSEDDEEEF